MTKAQIQSAKIGDLVYSIKYRGVYQIAGIRQSFTEDGRNFHLNSLENSDSEQKFVNGAYLEVVDEKSIDGIEAQRIGETKLLAKYWRELLARSKENG